MFGRAGALTHHHEAPRRRKGDSMTLGKIITIGGAILGALAAPAGWLATHIATKADLEQHVLEHKLDRQADNSAFQLFVTRDSLWKIEQRWYVIQECKDHGHRNCDP